MTSKELQQGRDSELIEYLQSIDLMRCSQCECEFNKNENYHPSDDKYICPECGYEHAF